MSVILEALRKARHDYEEPGYSGTRVVDVPRPTPHLAPEPRRGSRLLLLMFLLSSFLLVALLAGGLTWWYFGPGGRSLALGDMMSAATSPQRAVPPPGGHQLAAGAMLQPAAIPAVAGVAPVDLPPPVPITALPPPVVTSQQAAPAAAQAPAAPAAASPELKLGTILCDGADCSAIVNNRTVRVGDSIRGYRVAAITGSEVTLERKGEAPLVLSLVQ